MNDYIPSMCHKLKLHFMYHNVKYVSYGALTFENIVELLII